MLILIVPFQLPSELPSDLAAPVNRTALLWRTGRKKALDLALAFWFFPCSIFRMMSLTKAAPAKTRLGTTLDFAWCVIHGHNPTSSLPPKSPSVRISRSQARSDRQKQFIGACG